MKTNIFNWRYIGLAGCLATLLLAACGDDKEEFVVEPPLEPKLEVVNEDHTFSFSSAGNAAQVLTFAANQDWHIELNETEGVDNSWLVLFEREGKAGEENMVWVAAAENTDTEGRRVSFSLVSGEFKEDFTVYQAQMDAVVITDPKAYENLESGERIIMIQFATNAGDYEVKVDQEKWVVPTDEQPKGVKATREMIDHTLYYKVLANDKYDARRATIEIKSKEKPEIKATMNIIQLGLPKPVLTVENSDAFAAMPSKEDSIPLLYTMENVSGLKDLTMDIDKGDRDWITFKAIETEEGDSTFLIKVKENTGGERSATIALCAKVDNKYRSEFTITQAQAADVELVLTNKDKLKEGVVKYGGTITLKYSTKTPDVPVDEIMVDIVYPEETGYGSETGWLRVANKAMAGFVYLTCDTSKVLKDRQASVYVYRKGYESKRDYVAIRQDAATLIKVSKPGELKNTLQDLITNKVFKDWESITSLELGGLLNNDDFNLLRDMMKKGKGYNLKTLDMTALSNKTLKNKEFERCDLVENIILPMGLGYVPDECFRHCFGLRTIVVNEGPIYIGHHAFGGEGSEKDPKMNLQKVWLPSTLKCFYGYTFDNVFTLLEVHLKSLPIQVNETAMGPDNVANTVVFKKKPKVVYVPSEYVDYYKNPDPQHCVSLNFQDTLDELTINDPRWTAWPKDEGFVKKGNLRNRFLWPDGSCIIMPEP